MNPVHRWGVLAEFGKDRYYENAPLQESQQSEACRVLLGLTLEKRRQVLKQRIFTSPPRQQGMYCDFAPW